MRFLFLVLQAGVWASSLHPNLLRLLETSNVRENEVNPAVLGLKNFQFAQLNATIAKDARSFHTLNVGSPRYPDAWHLAFDAFGEQYSLQLEKNDDLLLSGYKHIRLSNVTQKTSSPFENCFYKAHIDDGYAAFATCAGVKGTIQTKSGRIGIEPLYKEPAEKQQQEQHHALHRSLLSIPSSSSTRSSISLFGGSPHVVFRYDVDEREPMEKDVCTVQGYGHSHPRRTLLADLKASVVTAQRHVNLLVVNDFSRYSKFKERVEYESIAAVNEIDALYRGSFSYLRIQLVAQITFDEGDPYSPIMRGSQTLVDGDDGLLTLFNHWRVTNKEVPRHDNGQLFSGRQFADSMVGLADMSSMCQGYSSGGVGAHKYSSTSRNAQVTAHELGHNLGMRHDGDMNPCATSGFVMASFSGPSTSFSSCSKDYLKSFLSHGHATCMNDKSSSSEQSLLETNITQPEALLTAAEPSQCSTVPHWSYVELSLSVAVLLAVTIASIYGMVIEMKVLFSWVHWTPPRKRIANTPQQQQQQLSKIRRSRVRSLSDSDVTLFR